MLLGCEQGCNRDHVWSGSGVKTINCWPKAPLKFTVFELHSATLHLQNNLKSKEADLRSKLVSNMCKLEDV